MSSLDVVCLGQMVADIVVRLVNGVPPSGKAHGVEAIELRSGGCTLNTALVLAKLGLQVEAAGMVGRDVFGDFLVSNAQKHGLSGAGIKRTKEVQTSSVIVLIAPSGERSFLCAAGASEALSLHDVDFDLIGRARILHVGGVMKLFSLKTAKVLSAAKKLGVTTSLDTDWDTSGRWLSGIEDALPHVDIFLPSYEEAIQLSGKTEPAAIAEFFLAYGIRIFVLKMGKGGCYVRTAEREFAVPIFKVETKDTTGAGDAFVAGFLAGLCHEWDLEEAARFANACGALCTTAIGTTDGIVSMAATQTFMRAAAAAS